MTNEEAIKELKSLIDDFVSGDTIEEALTHAIEVLERENEYYLHKGGEDDGYGGKTTPYTYKEAYEEELRYDKWAREEMWKACEKIKAHPKWGAGQNAFPSSYERAIVAGCGQAVEELQEKIKQLEQELEVCRDAFSSKKRELHSLRNKDKLVMEEVEREIRKFVGNQYGAVVINYENLAQAIVDRFEIKTGGE